jgi:hypothetical protein
VVVHAHLARPAGGQDERLGGPVEVERLQPQASAMRRRMSAVCTSEVVATSPGAIRSRPWSCSSARAAATDGWAVSASGWKALRAVTIWETGVVTVSRGASPGWPASSMA